MLTAKFDPQSFFQQADNIALHVPAAEIFSLLKRSIDLPSQWGALVQNSNGTRAIVAAGGVVESGDVDSVLFVRLVPVEIGASLELHPSRDGFGVSCEVRMRVCPLAEVTELQAFLKQVVGSHRAINATRLADHFEAVIRGAMSVFVQERDAADLVEGSAEQAAREALATALQVSFFTCGVLPDDPRNIAITFGSKDYGQVRRVREDTAMRLARQEASNKVNEALHAARDAHLDRLADSLTRLKEMTSATPEAALPDLIRTFSDHQRGQLYEALFATDVPEGNTQWIVVVTSDELLFFDPLDPAEPKRRMNVAGQAGRARSVQTGEGKSLFLGASNGVYVWPIDQATMSRTFLVQKALPRGGFNSAVKHTSTLAASHSELGICDWNWEDGELRGFRFEELTSGAKAVRGLCVFGEDWYCSVDDRVLRWRSGSANQPPDSIYTGSHAILTAILPTLNGLYAGTSDGDLLYWPTGSTDTPEMIQKGQGRPVDSIALQQLHGVERLVYADTSSRIHARVLNDSFTMHYEAGGQTLRRAKIGPEILVATNELRDRLFCWKPAQPDKPAWVLPIGSQTGRNVQDFCLVAADDRGTI